MRPDHRTCCTEISLDHAHHAQGLTRLALRETAPAARNPEGFDRSHLTRPQALTTPALEYTTGTLVPALNASYNLHTDQLHAAQQG